MSSIPSTDPALKARLLCRMRPGFTERFAVPASEAVVGREPGLAVTIPVDGVSRRHARIAFDGRSYWIENLSPAGTFLNGVLVAKERLAHLDVITLGKNVDLLFVLRPEDAVAATVDGIVRAALVPETLDAVPYEIAPGEILMGRSTANNVVAEASGAVSKIHARIERTPQQLILRDLGSSNGTFVNGQRVMTALLVNGDVIALANVVQYRVIVERGAVTAPPTGAAAVEAPAPAEVETRMQFSPEWKTRYDWDSGEIKDIAALQAGLIAEDLERKRAKAKREAPTEKAGALGAVKAAVVKAAAAKAPPAPPVPRPGRTEKVPVVTPAVIAAADAAAADAAAAAAKNDASAVKAAADALAAQAAKVARPREDKPPRITAIRLSGPGGDLEVKEPGEYVLGRAKDAALRVDHPTISRRHALVVLSADGEAFLDDAGGANGTRLNGLLVQKRSRISDGDRISIGAVELTVRLTAG
jgi:pSer/pThr/pTyr-binding forkhead associated (FHA) protein